MPCERNNPCNRENFELAVTLLSEAFPDRKFTIENIYLDYGAGMMWDCICCEKTDSHWGSYQYLYPSDWDKLQDAELEDVPAVVEKFVENTRRTGY